MEKEPRKPEIGTYIALGLCFGTVLGVILNKIQFGPALGLLVGVVAHNIALANYRKKTGNKD
ncbi:MAG: hypothetical protein ACOX5Q_05665 [Bacillota bacterium]|jgi:hypothetical protein|nr:hypothetical protein [Candidatus Fermentithermobacillaceae bacterium]HHX28108.1 hypothetical protein [Candidatus Fermentithermobacillaceae bacterium]